ncbi:ATP-binding protein [Nannocystis pusilla]|uniref:histidine kinase n=1 Tax=Nannocystis pusilla TaxID=889268 RepID=A0ABS7TJ33_9BACT|nr:ATP-binding protein [Nannocystis pusilla]MBZ5708121.1 GAF domain-containing protein [Nannocystis pusilla]
MPRKRTSVVATLLRVGLLGKEDWDVALHQLLEIACDLIGVERASYWSLRADPSSLVCELGYVATEKLLERGHVVRERDHPEYFAEIHRVQVLDIADTRADPRSRSLGEYLTIHAIRSMLDVPVFSRGELIGVLCHERLREGPWSSRECELALTMSHILSSLIEAQARTWAEENERRATFLARASTAVAQALDLDEAYAAAVQRAIPTLGELATLIRLEGEQARCVATAHVRPERRRQVEEMCAQYCHGITSSGIGFRALRERQSLLVPCVDADTLRRLGLPRRHIDAYLQLGVRSTMSVLLFARDVVTGVMTFASDNRHYDRDDLRFAEAYAQQLGVVLENTHLLAQTREALRTRDDFLVLAGHELRTPIAALKFAVDLLRRRLPAPVLPGVQRSVETIARQATRMSRLIDLVILAPLQEGRAPPPPTLERVDLTELVRDVLHDCADLPAQRGCTVRFTAAGPVVVRGDRTGLEVVVTNLLNNAVKFGAGRPVEVSVGDDDGLATVIVRDHGIGIPPERLPHIFRRFERAVPRSFGGLGLGLSIAASIVTGLGGEIRVDSRAGEGSTFTVALPTPPPPSSSA